MGRGYFSPCVLAQQNWTGQYILSCVQPPPSAGARRSVDPDQGPCVGGGSEGLKHVLFPFCSPETRETVVPERLM